MILTTSLLILAGLIASMINDFRQIESSHLLQSRS